MNNPYFLVLILLAVVFEAVADISFKYAHLANKQMWLWLGVGLYTVGTVIWAFSLRYEYLSKAISIFTVLNLIAVILVGVLFFHENLSLLNKFGIGLGILAVILMQV
ncbi:MAG: SMR family transporter [bacterium]|nr:SMR family transporter [bacterium]